MLSKESERIACIHASLTVDTVDVQVLKAVWQQAISIFS